jgi:hypothetical protein
LSAIGIGLLSLAAMLGVRLQRRLQPATVLASSAGLGPLMPRNTASALGDNAMEMKSEDPHKVNSSRVGWGQLSSQNSRPLTHCYAGKIEPPNPLLTYLSVMGAPVYGRDILPFLGGLLDFETLEPRSSPNEYLAAPADAAPLFNSTDKRTEAPVYAVSAEDLRASFEAALAKRQPVAGDFWAKPVKEDSSSSTRPSEFAMRYVYVERTPLFRFPDIINVQFLDAGNGTSTLVLHSASVYGYDDVGKNKERVEDLLKRISDSLANRGF